MDQKIEPLNMQDLEWLENNRKWLVGHFDNPDDYLSLPSKLKLIQTVLQNGWVEKEDTAKLQALGIAFGDALEQEVEQLHWVAVEDDFGRDPALRWLDTSVLVFPHTSISKRVEDGIDVDVYELFGGFQKAVRDAVEKQS